MGGRHNKILVFVTRLLVFFVVMVFVAEVVWTDTVLDALMGLVFAGAVPGTDIVLSPDSILMGLVVLSCLVLLYALIRIMWKLYRAVRQRTQDTLAPVPALQAVVVEPPQVVTAQQEPETTEEVVTTHTSDDVVPATLTTKRAIPSWLTAASGSVLRRSMAIVRSLAARTPIIKAATTSLARSLTVFLVMVARVVWRAMRTFRKLAVAYFIAAWRWTEPRVRALDARIEKLVKAVTRNIAAFVRRNENVAFLFDISHRTLRLAQPGLGKQPTLTTLENSDKIE